MLSPEEKKDLFLTILEEEIMIILLDNRENDPDLNIKDVVELINNHSISLKEILCVIGKGIKRYYPNIKLN